MRNGQRSAFKTCLLPLGRRNLQSRQIEGALVVTETPRGTKSQSQRSKGNLSTSETSETDERQSPGANPHQLMAMKKQQPRAQLRVPLRGVCAPSAITETAFTLMYVINGIRGQGTVDLLLLRGDEKNRRDESHLLVCVRTSRCWCIKHYNFDVIVSFLCGLN